jgi:hypothetical protein
MMQSTCMFLLCQVKKMRKAHPRGAARPRFALPHDGARIKLHFK